MVEGATPHDLIRQAEAAIDKTVDHTVQACIVCKPDAERVVEVDEAITHTECALLFLRAARKALLARGGPGEVAPRKKRRRVVAAAGGKGGGQ